MLLSTEAERQAEREEALGELDAALRELRKVRDENERIAFLADQERGDRAFVCFLVATLIVIAVVVLLWMGVEVYPRRIAFGVVVAWLLLALWPFADWLWAVAERSRKERES
jgi:Flp pilus assembly protein TadB